MRSRISYAFVGFVGAFCALAERSAWRGSLHSKTAGALFGMTLMGSSLIPGLA